MQNLLFGNESMNGMCTKTRQNRLNHTIRIEITNIQSTVKNSRFQTEQLVISLLIDHANARFHTLKHNNTDSGHFQTFFPSLFSL